MPLGQYQNKNKPPHLSFGNQTRWLHHLQENDECQIKCSRLRVLKPKPEKFKRPLKDKYWKWPTRTESKCKQTAQARENTSDQVMSGFRFELIWLIDGVAWGLWTNYRAKFKATLMEPRSLSRLGTHASPSTNQILGSKEINHDLIVCAFLLSRPFACFTLSINRSLVMLPCSD